MKLIYSLVVVLMTSFMIVCNSNAAIVEKKVLDELNFHKTADILIEMGDQVNFETLKNNLKKMDFIARGRFVFKLLTEKAESTQKEVRKIITKKGLKYTNFWIQNTIYVKSAPRDLIIEISALKSVSTIKLDAKEIANWEVPDPSIKTPSKASREDSAEWGIEWINATSAWARGFKGKGVVLATADSGTNWQHRALIGNYRGNNGDGTYSHDFNWYDPVARSPNPVDGNGHGSHVQGTVTGGVDRNIGVAPEAKWISCRIADRAFSPANVLACWQFILAPHDLNRQNANPDKRPHVCSHSYTCGSCSLDGSVAAHKAAGIYVVVAAGNSGPRCQSHGYPSRLKDSLSIGALGARTNVIARFSSRGPGLNNLSPKPAYAFPGSSVVSASRLGSGYSTLSGTSMAAPHANGAIGLLWSAVPDLIGKFEETEKIFNEAALRQTSNDCSSNGSPNNVYGYGTVDINKAIEIAQKIYSKQPISK